MIMITDVKFIDQTNKSHHVKQNFNISAIQPNFRTMAKGLRNGKKNKKNKRQMYVSKAWVDCYIFASYFQVFQMSPISQILTSRHPSVINVQLSN